MILRREALKRIALGAAGLWLAPDVLEVIARPPRRLWPGHDFTNPRAFSRQLLLQANPDIEALIRADLAAMHALALDKYFMYGDGSL